MPFRQAVEKVREGEFYHWQEGRALGLMRFAGMRYGKGEPVEHLRRIEALLDLYYKMTVWWFKLDRGRRSNLRVEKLA